MAKISVVSGETALGRIRQVNEDIKTHRRGYSPKQDDDHLGFLAFAESHYHGREGVHLVELDTDLGRAVETGEGVNIKGANLVLCLYDLGENDHPIDRLFQIASAVDLGTALLFGNGLNLIYHGNRDWTRVYDRVLPQILAIDSSGLKLEYSDPNYLLVSRGGGGVMQNPLEQINVKKATPSGYNFHFRLKQTPSP